ncbi:hypothetical protein D3C73_919730 [compost metagenome]
MAPLAIFRLRPNTNIMKIAMLILPDLANQINPTPSTSNSMAKRSVLPSKPQVLPILSATMPPSGRAKMLIQPKIPATMPATAIVAPNESVKKIGAKLSTVISTPKQAA